MKISKKILYYNKPTMKNILLSYPRSGNHLTRFMIELLTELPTFGCHTNKNDIPIYQNTFPNKIPFNINLDIKDIDTTNSYHKYHNPVNNYDINNLENLIFIIRNPKEVLLRHNDYQIKNSSFDLYFNCIDFYLNFSGKKILFFYEDIVTNKVDFIKNLYDFLNIKILSKLEYNVQTMLSQTMLSQSSPPYSLAAQSSPPYSLAVGSKPDYAEPQNSETLLSIHQNDSLYGRY